MQIELEPKEVEAVLNTLAQLPYNQSAGLIQKINEQAQAQAAEANVEKLLEPVK